MGLAGETNVTSTVLFLPLHSGYRCITVIAGHNWRVTAVSFDITLLDIIHWLPILIVLHVESVLFMVCAVSTLISSY